MEYLVSIRCNTFNQASYIEDAMNGFCMQQTNFPFVAVIIDDASTDGEQEVIRKYVDEHFDHSPESGFKEWETEDAFWTFAQHKENKNCYFVAVYLKKNLFGNPKKNAITKEFLQSKYIALCEGDDYWVDPHKLQKQVDFLEGHEECSMTACAAYWETIEGKREIHRVSDRPRNLTTDEVILGGGGYLTTCSLVANRKKLFDSIPQWRKMANVGDFPLQIHATLVGELHFIPDVMCVYRNGVEGSWSNKYLRGDIQHLMSHRRAEIVWMQELDKATIGKYQVAIYTYLKDYYPALYQNRMLSFKEYLHSVRVIGGRDDYMRLLRKTIKRMMRIHC